MESNIFRKKSIDRVSSPEQLNDYIKVSNPSVWMVLIAVIVLLIGICVWSVFGHLDTKVNVVGICTDGNITCYVSNDDIHFVKTGMPLTINEKQYEITDISESPVVINSNMNTSLLTIGNLKVGELVYEVTANTGLTNGTYQAFITTDRVSPISFVFN